MLASSIRRTTSITNTMKNQFTKARWAPFLTLLLLFAAASRAVAQASALTVSRASLGNVEYMHYPGNFSWDAAARLPMNRSFRRQFGDGWGVTWATTADEASVIVNLLKSAAQKGAIRDGSQVAIGLVQIISANTNAASGRVTFNEPSGGWTAMSYSDVETSPLDRSLPSPYFGQWLPFDTNNGRRARNWWNGIDLAPSLTELLNAGADYLITNGSTRFPATISNAVQIIARQSERGDEDVGGLYVANGRRGEFRGNDAKMSVVMEGGVLLARIKPSLAGGLPSWPTVTINGARRALSDGETLRRVVGGRATTLNWNWYAQLGYMALWDNLGVVYSDGTKATPAIDLRTLPAGRTFDVAIRRISPSQDVFERFSFTTR
jgi:hypothetical protein